MAGTGLPEFAGEGVYAPTSAVNKPRHMTVSETGILIADTFNHRVREIR